MIIDVSRQLKPAPKRTEKRLLKEEHAKGIKAIYARGAELMPADYLIVHADSDQERVYKIQALAKARRLQRNAKRLANQAGKHREPAFAF